MKFKIGGCFGYFGTEWEDEIEAEDQEEAETIARDHILDRVEWWAEHIADGSNDDAAPAPEKEVDGG